MALIGNTGGIFIRNNNKIILNPLLKNISESEWTIINKILVLGFYYSKIKAAIFITAEETINQILNIEKELLIEREQGMEIEMKEDNYDKNIENLRNLR